jgi:hypothetical protein
MKATELRPSNMVNWVLDTTEGEKLTLAVIRCLHMNVAEDETGQTHAYCRLVGIPLTDTVLISAGFNKTDRLPFYQIEMPDNIGQIHINPDNGIVWLRHGRNENTMINPKSIFYVHQLQNLYFALTGQELEFAKVGE